mgnify:CR=1 FL=1
MFVPLNGVEVQTNMAPFGSIMYNITPLVPVTPWDGQGFGFVIITMLSLLVSCVSRMLEPTPVGVEKTPAALFAEGRDLLEKAILMYAEENPVGFSNAAISAALCADPSPSGDQKGWITYKYISSLCASGTLERVEVFDESDERLPKAKFTRAKRAFMEQSNDPTTLAEFIASPRLQRRYLKPSIVYRKSRRMSWTVEKN